MTEPGEPADDTVGSESEIDDQSAGDGAGQGGPTTVPAGGATTETTAPRRSRLRNRRVLQGIGVATGATIVLLVGGVAVGSVVGDDDPSPRREAASSTSFSTTTTAETTTTSTTTTSTTTTTVPPTTADPAGEPTSGPTAGDDGVMTPITTPSNTVPMCGLGPWGESHPQATVPGPPEQAKLINGPNWNCANVTTGCNVSISTTWSDGVTASDSQVLTAPGTYTLNDGRGTTATFSVSSDLSCAFGSANYSTVWPPGA